ncbi:hypothetical protein GGR56DRAFT_369442 [Xylariaceae sp. FL0804]|nr:hypothetical protein GGR56DRAFT_369442 [Xylariaceae sp. FL0804]
MPRSIYTTHLRSSSSLPLALPPLVRRLVAESVDGGCLAHEPARDKEREWPTMLRTHAPLISPPSSPPPRPEDLAPRRAPIFRPAAAPAAAPAAGGGGGGSGDHGRAVSALIMMVVVISSTGTGMMAMMMLLLPLLLLRWVRLRASHRRRGAAAAAPRHPNRDVRCRGAAGRRRRRRRRATEPRATRTCASWRAWRCGCYRVRTWAWVHVCVRRRVGGLVGPDSLVWQSRRCQSVGHQAYIYVLARYTRPCFSPWACA